MSVQLTDQIALLACSPIHFLIVGSAIACRTTILLQRARTIIASGNMYNPLNLMADAYITWFIASIISKYLLIVYATMCGIRCNIPITDTLLYVSNFVFLGVMVNATSEVLEYYYPVVIQGLFAKETPEETELNTEVIGENTEVIGENTTEAVPEVNTDNTENDETVINRIDELDQPVIREGN